MPAPPFVLRVDALEGGYVIVGLDHIDELATACCGPLRGDRFALRAWTAMVEVSRRFEMDEESDLDGAPDFDTQVVRLMRASKRSVAEKALRRLRLAAASPEYWNTELIAGRMVPLPRRALRWLAKHGSAGAIACWLHACKRGSFLYGAELRLGGLLRARETAATWGLDPSSVKRGRATLVQAGLLVPVPQGRRFESANGWAFQIPSGWSETQPDAGPGHAETAAAHGGTQRTTPHESHAKTTETERGAPPLESSAPPTGIQRTTPGNPAHPLQGAFSQVAFLQGSSDKQLCADAHLAAGKSGEGKPKSAEPSSSAPPQADDAPLHVELSDLTTPAGRERLCDKAERDRAVAAVWKSEAGRIRIHALAIQIGKRDRLRDPCAVMASWLRRADLPQLTDRDEESARASRAEALGHSEESDDDLVCGLVNPIAGAAPAPQHAWEQLRRSEEERARQRGDAELARRQARTREALRKQASAEAAYHTGLVTTDEARVAGAFPRKSHTASGAS